MVGIISGASAGQFANPSGYTLFILHVGARARVPIRADPAPPVSAAPAYQTTQPMTARAFAISLPGCIGTFVLGGAYAAIFGMASVFGTSRGLNVSQISVFVAAIYFGGLIRQFPIGWALTGLDR